MEKQERLKRGLSELEVQAARAQYGSNVLTPPPSTPWWKLLLEKFQDPIIMILVAAAIISIIVGIIDGNLIEPIGILIAIGLATGVGFWMEWSAKKKFDILNQAKDSEPVKVIRSGQTMEIPKTDLVPGDVVILATGDEVPADLDMYEAINLKIDESSMTGESVPASKTPRESAEDWAGSGFAPWEALRGTRVMEGSGTGIVTKTGDNTEIGKTTRAAMEESGLDTPLQKQLDGLASLITKAAFGMAAILLVFLNGHHWFFVENPDTTLFGIFLTELKFIMMAVALIVMSVPEGLSLATVISLAFSMKTMAKENNLVKKMHACETIGAVNVIFSDKTGTLTQNKMTVVETHVASGYNVADIIENAAVNSSASLGASGETIGNPSEGAMLRYIENQNISWKTIRENTKVVAQKPFNSTDKYMSSTIESGVIYVKGAPEVISGLCQNTEFLGVVEEQQGRGRRAISCAQGTSMDDLEYTGTFFIEDPVRPDVPDAIKTCRQAGIDVVMMTGDNIKTAKEIGRQAGLAEDPWAIEAKDFDNVAWGDPHCGYPQVIARCKPSDKLHILQEFQKLHYVCAMTGDGRQTA
jgi:Ca2+-transporting ATPase